MFCMDITHMITDLIICLFSSFLFLQETFDRINFLAISHFENYGKVATCHDGIAIFIKNRSEVAQFVKIIF